VSKRKAKITRGTFDYERDGRTHSGTFIVESGHVNIWTSDGSAHAAQNIQTIEQIIGMLLSLELGSKLVNVAYARGD